MDHPNLPGMRRLFHRSTLIILLLWAAITALDFSKAFHIDDTFHLKAAQWIEQHPGKPMSGKVNWGYDPEPIHDFNQPPGFFYLVALTGHLFGYTEGPMHLMRSLFTLLALFGFHRLARVRAPRHALWLTALFALCPAFMVNQGLMTDVPLLAMHLLFFNLLLVPGPMNAGPRYALAGLALSGAMLIKYTSVPLLLVFPLVLALKREWRWLPMTLIPVVFLAGWAAWNLHEFGSIHLLDRRAGDPSIRGIFVRSLALLTALGAVSPFAPAFLRAVIPGAVRWLLPAWITALVLSLVFVAGSYAGLIAEQHSDQVLRILFTLNGLLLVLYCARFLPRSLRASSTDTWAVVLWVLGLATFLALFSPMMATRHVLLLVPPLLLLIASALDAARLGEKVLAVASTAALGLLLTLSDKSYADFYRENAPRIAEEMKARTEGTVWSLGHWGWQWYAEQAGMVTYARTRSDVAVGDILVVPQDHDVQLLAKGLTKEAIASWDEAPGPATFFCVEQFAGMYTSSYGKLPWSLSRSHHKTILAYRVTGVHGGR
jgi:hypothetical protein